MALGLIGSEQLDNYWSRNIRRRVAYDFPQGSAVLTELLSHFESEETPLPSFGWQEQRYSQISTTTLSSGQPTADVVFYLGGTTTTAGTPITITVGLSLRAYVTDASNFQIDDTIMFVNLSMTSGTDNLHGRVTAKNTTGADYIDFECTSVPVAATPTVVNTTSAEGKYLFLTGSAYAEGSRSRSGRSKFPIEVGNYTQMHKNAFALTSHALKAPLVYNKSGQYQIALKDNGIDHLEGLEKTLIWGERRTTTAEDSDTGETVRRDFAGGIIWFLKQWEKGNITNGGAFDYRPGGADVTAQTDWETYTDKRIIKLAGTTLSRSQFNELTSRAFEKTNNTSWEKLVICGQGYLNKVTESFEKQIHWTSMRDNGFKGWDFQLMEHQSNAGKVYYKTHPLFADANLGMRNSALVVDLGFLKMRHLTDHDTDVQTGIQPNDALIRKDQYLTVHGPEIWYPEAHMWIDNLGGITL